MNKNHTKHLDLLAKIAAGFFGFSLLSLAGHLIAAYSSIRSGLILALVIVGGGGLALITIISQIEMWKLRKAYFRHKDAQIAMLPVIGALVILVCAIGFGIAVGG